MTTQPLSLQWLVFLRDHGADLKLTLGERALASLLPTYGQGKNIFVSMHKLAAVTGWSRNTVKKHRDGLIAKGLLEDTTGDPDKLNRTYRLTMPGYVTQAGSEVDLGMDQILTQVDQVLTQDGSESDHNIKTEIKLEDQASTPAAPGGDGVAAKNKKDGHSSVPSRVSVPSLVPLEVPGSQVPQVVEVPYVDWADPDNGESLAEVLGVPHASIGEPFWRWLDSQKIIFNSEMNGLDDYPAVASAARISADKRSPVGYFQKILPGYLEGHRAA